MMAVSDQPDPPEPLDRRRLVVGTAWTLLIFGLCLFLPAGTWAWPRGWLFFVVVVAALLAVSFYLRKANPDIYAARVNRHQGTKPWDRWVVGILIPLIVATIPLAAVDDARFHWSRAPWWVCGIGYLFLFAGLAGITWAEAVNKFFEPTVRIQSDRGHHVIDTGPYAIVRHPGYVAACPFIIGIPLALGSYWALIPAMLSCLMLVVRTVLEDRTLHDELSGYSAYAQRVRYRLIPWVW
jgi:protein-S-isoprenylcysteine O-methyltransferase Ste14